MAEISILLIVIALLLLVIAFHSGRRHQHGRGLFEFERKCPRCREIISDDRASICRTAEPSRPGCRKRAGVVDEGLWRRDQRSRGEAPCSGREEGGSEEGQGRFIASY
jgi:hypothetical protein